ncbi:tyrosyl-tRNA synthetase [Phycisphaerales bacterium]|nr:tyrosyl-tRNA synthetase [Phycisphaerales bacterium]
MTSFLDELAWRGRLAQVTDDAGLRKHLAGGVRRAYIGFDPTADSLTVGNLVQIITLALIQRSGHTPVVVVGGGTGLIGDPSGKTAERTLRTRDEVNANVERQKRIYERILDFSQGVSNRAMLLNNADWLCELSYLDALRDIGKHFSVNMMIQKDSVRERLHNRDQGISYTEFSYMILQAYDFLHLYEKHGVTIQSGGSDQWGNIVAGTDLVRRKHAAEGEAAETYGITTQLITKSDGGKFGKTESGAIWLTANRPGETSPNRTSPYAFYQFWLNTADADVPKFLRTFTLLPREEIERLESIHAADPGKREAHRSLARHMTEMLHGKTEMESVELAAKALFSGDVRSVNVETLLQVVEALPPEKRHVSKADEPTGYASVTGSGVNVLEIVAASGVTASNREAKEAIQSGAISINGVRIAGVQQMLTASDLIRQPDGGLLALVKRGKKTWGGVVIPPPAGIVPR